MNSPEIFKINDERFKKWRDEMTRDHFTPIVVVGVGHNINKDTMTVMTIPEVTDEKLLMLISDLHRTVTRRIEAIKQRPIMKRG